MFGRTKAKLGTHYSNQHHQQFSSVHATNYCIAWPLKKRFFKKSIILEHLIQIKVRPFGQAFNTFFLKVSSLIKTK